MNAGIDNPAISGHPRMRRGRGKSRESLAIIDAATDILAEIQPASVRAVCYRLFALGLIPNMSKGSTDKVSRLLVGAREDGTIPWGWIVDETREVERVSAWNSPDELIASAVRQYRKDYWQEQPERVEVWSEKGTIRGTLKPILDEYGVAFRVMHGYGSATAIKAAAEDSLIGDKLLTAFYVGDFDPSGLHMSEVDLPARLDRYNGVINLRRVALTDDDVAPGTRIPSFDAATKIGDPRHRWFRERYGSRCWELDAMSPVALRDRVRDAVVEMLDVNLWKQAVGVERVERASMGDFMTTWQGLFRGQPENSPATDQEAVP